MDNQRLFTWGLFGLMLFVCWNAWQIDYGPKPPSAPVETTAAAGPESVATIPGERTEAPAIGNSLPEVAQQSVADTPVAAANAATTASRDTIRVQTDVLDVTIDLVSGDIVGAVLKKYPVDKKREDDLVTLLAPSGTQSGRFQTGLIFNGQSDGSPTHFVQYQAAKRDFTLADGTESLAVPLTWQAANGATVTKEFVFHRGLYQVDLTFSVNNSTAEAINAVPYGRIVRQAVVPERSMVDVDTYSFTGPVTFDGDTYDKHDIDDLQDGDQVSFSTANGWIAAIQHHFVVALVPEPSNAWNYKVSADQNDFLVGAIGNAAAIDIAAGSSSSLPMTLFVGPKLQSQLAAIAPKLKLTVDYGILTLLAQPLFWLLEKVHELVKNWGVAIILATFLIKLAFYRLTAASGRSMAKMRELQPRLKKLQERYADDRQALSREMMDLYKKEKINPAAGCLPLLIQMPFFLAFYWVLLESVEMRQAPFMLWINDLSSRDPFFVLPLLMGVAMFFQQKLNPAPADPIQAKVMSFLPVVFTVFFAFFPAGLVLYWLTNTLLSIAQQWRINKLVHAEQAARA